MGEHKKLRIKYRFQRNLHEVIVEDTAPVACPLRCKCFIVLYSHTYVVAFGKIRDSSVHANTERQCLIFYIYSACY